MNYILPKFDEELYESLVEIVAEKNSYRYWDKCKTKFISKIKYIIIL